MLVYIIIFGIAFLSILFDNKSVTRKTKKWIVGFLVVMLTCFYGLRWHTGTDWLSYLEYWYAAGWNTIFSLHRYGEQTLEPGFVLMMVIPKSIYDSYNLYLVVSNLFRFVLFAIVAFRLSPKYPIVTFVFLTASLLLFPTRIPYAYALILFGYIFVVERNFKAWVATWLVACSIHVSAIAAFPIYFLYGMRIAVPLQVAFYLMTVVLDAEISDIVRAVAPALVSQEDASGTMSVDLAAKVAHYSSIEEGGVEERSIPTYIVEFIVLMMANYCLLKLKLKPKERKKIEFVITCYCLSLLIKNTFMEHLYYFERLKGYLDCLPFIVPLFLRTWNKQRILVLVLLIAFLFYRLNKQILNGVFTQSFIPYTLTPHF